MNFKLTWTPHLLNFGLFGIGMLGVWSASHSGWALFWTFVASIHVTFTTRRDADAYAQEKAVK